MKKLFQYILIVLCMCLVLTSTSFSIDINGMTEEEIIQRYEEIKKERERIKISRDSKFEIIKNNNIEIEKLKKEAITSINSASKKVDNMLYKIKNNEVSMTQETINLLKNSLEVLQDSNVSIKSSANDLRDIVKMIKIKGYDSSVLSVLDSAIEKQNTIIVSYKQIINNLGML